MTANPPLWMRHEIRPTERRAPLVPLDAARLVRGGASITVEESPQRAFPIGDYAAAGCAVAGACTWPDASPDTVVLGLKELPDLPRTLRHRHIYFGHAYKGQPHAAHLLRRFRAGGGALLDLEHLTGDDGRRLVAFGHWAGYVGAALAVLHHRGRLTAPLVPTTVRAIEDALRERVDDDVRALVVGALGRCGRGAREALALAGVPTTAWDVEETDPLDRDAVLDHDILVNAVFASGPAEPLLTRAELARRTGRLRIVADVTCDSGSPADMLPVYDRPTTWEQPVGPLRDAASPIDLIAIDNLPSLVPEESSVAFSAQLAPHLATVGEMAPPWRRCLAAYERADRSVQEKDDV
ncbi:MULTISPECIES: saccharopine dehydrogenase [Actinomadura]|uniref:Saccharopine dehydrogenase [NAD(+), L-lysine-forming] n=1 Tax=Actinomadura yumaensis TaxID=111807 RepID=A0ABW2CF01_9ACTN|nr:saccharopine dehydrogenase [Actinomadura sp. J1-007]MWK34984.1 saccharopine dehydrogenase [Actinomadura sp. J1-007]